MRSVQDDLRRIPNIDEAFAYLRATEAAEARAKLVERAKAKEGQPGVTRLRERLYAATHEALQAENEAAR